VTKTTPPAAPTELARLEPGSSFGEMSLVDHDLRSASVIARRSCTLLRMNETACWSQPIVSAKIFRNIARILSSRLRNMDEAYVLSR
jgi:CRP-like cAMP-binding protein